MFEKTLIKGTRKNLALLGRSGILKDAYLGGGTAAALQLGHRISVDFDFFTAKEFVPKVFSDELSTLGSFNEEQASKGTILGEFEGVKFSLFIYKHPLIYPLLKYLSVNIADIRDIAAMKIDAIATRGAKRDFIDLYFICKSGYKLNDAEPDKNPKLLKEVSWEEVKKYFEEEVKKLAG